MLGIDVIISQWSLCISYISGNATRFCDNTGQWDQPNVLNCTSPQFIELEDLVSVIIHQHNYKNGIMNHIYGDKIIISGY